MWISFLVSPYTRVSNKKKYSSEIKMLFPLHSLSTGTSLAIHKWSDSRVIITSVVLCIRDRSLFIAGGCGGFWGHRWLFRMREWVIIHNWEPKRGSLNVTCPYRLCGRLFDTLKGNLAVSKHLGWLVAGMSTDISRRVLSRWAEFYRL